MRLEKLFNVLVIAGASSAGLGLAGCGSDNSGGAGGGGSSGKGGSSGGGASSTGGVTSVGGADTGGATGTGGADTAACDAVCHPSATVATWTDCNGCCCWLAVGKTTTFGSPICGVEPCCAGHGR